MVDAPANTDAVAVQRGSGSLSSFSSICFIQTFYLVFPPSGSLARVPASVRLLTEAEKQQR